MKSRLITIALSLAVIATLVFVGCAPAPEVPESAPTEKPGLESFTVKLSYVTGENHGMTVYGVKPWAEYIEDITDGRVKVEHYPDAVLHSFNDSFMAVETGLTDLTFICQQNTPGRFPLMDLFTLPGLFPNQATSDCVLRDLYNKYPAFIEQYGDKVEHILDHVHMRADLHTSEPVRTLQELQGKRIACWTDASAEALSNLGASTTVQIGADTYLAAERGVVDGVFCAWGAVLVWNYNEVCPYHTLLGLSPTTSAWLINKDTFNKFTPEEQWKLKQYKFEGMSNLCRAMSNMRAQMTKELPKENMIDWPIEDMAEMRVLFSPSWEKWADQMEEQGYPGHAILEDAVRLIEEYSRA